MKHFFIKIFKIFFTGITGAVIVIIALAVLYLDNQQDLNIWHTAELDAEFFVGSPVAGFDEYLELEKRLFQQLDEKVIQKISPEDRNRINRYHRGSLSDPEQWDRNWNRTFELTAQNPKAGVLLLHGMSDSPYSLRHIGQTLHAKGAWVIGLRLPGHGTAPSGLVTAKWEDMAAAVRLAMEHLRGKIKDAPLYMIGYSNGGALSVQYALTSLLEKNLPKPDRMVLLSPAIGVTPAAALAVWQARLGHLLGLEKLAWNSILPEYDPFKYGSFAVNAGDQSHRLTVEIRSQLQALKKTGKLKQFPPVLAFQSVVDATVSTSAVINVLFNQLPANGHELVLFDINNYTDIEFILKFNPKLYLESLLNKAIETEFSIAIVSNADKKTTDVIEHFRKAGHDDIAKTVLNTSWPANIYSLSHVALPFPPDDPLYGAFPPESGNQLNIGKLALHGERGVLKISMSDLFRLRWNPFFSYQEKKLVRFLSIE